MEDEDEIIHMDVDRDIVYGYQEDIKRISSIMGLNMATGS